MAFDLADTSRISYFMEKVAYITGGAALTALPHESIYYGTKAGIHMFAQCIGNEQKEKEYGFEMVTIGPGMVDTDMQQQARSQNKEDYVWVDIAKQVYENGELQETGEVADKIYTILENKYNQSQCVKVSEINYLIMKKMYEKEKNEQY